MHKDGKKKIQTSNWYGFENISKIALYWQPRKEFGPILREFSLQDNGKWLKES